MKVGDLIKIKRKKGRPNWIGLVIDTYVTRNLVDRRDATTEWRDVPGIIIHWMTVNHAEHYDESHWDMLEVVNESR